MREGNGANGLDMREERGASGTDGGLEMREGSGASGTDGGLEMKKLKWC